MITHKVQSSASNWIDRLNCKITVSRLVIYSVMAFSKKLKLILESSSTNSSPPGNQPDLSVAVSLHASSTPQAHPRFNEVICRTQMYKVATHPTSCCSSSWSPFGGSFTSQLMSLQFPQFACCGDEGSGGAGGLEWGGKESWWLWTPRGKKEHKCQGC